MPRARLIKPSFFTNEDIVSLPPETQLLFIGLWMLADREGRLEDRPMRIKMSIFPAANYDVNLLIQALAESKLVIRYEVNGNRFISIPNFVKHQKPHPNEPASVIPDSCNVASTSYNGRSASDNSIRARALPSEAEAVAIPSEAVEEVVPLEESPELPPKRGTRASTKESQDQFLARLKADTTYEGIDINREHGKAQVWCQANRRECTPRFFVNWLNRIDRPLNQPNRPAAVNVGAPSEASETELPIEEVRAAWTSLADAMGAPVAELIAKAVAEGQLTAEEAAEISR